jgi:hypothetical protein
VTATSRSSQRKPDLHFGALPDLAANFEQAAVTLYDLTDDREAETGASAVAAPGRINSVETLGKTREMLGGDALAVVANDQPLPMTDLIKSDLDSRTRVLATIANRIVEEIVDDLPKLGRITSNRGQVISGSKRNLAATVFHKNAGGPHRFLHDLSELEPFAGLPEPVCLDAGQAHEIADDAEHAFGLRVDLLAKALA